MAQKNRREWDITEAAGEAHQVIDGGEIRYDPVAKHLTKSLVLRASLAIFGISEVTALVFGAITADPIVITAVVTSSATVIVACIKHFK